jgi:hypothetical protein
LDTDLLAHTDGKVYTIKQLNHLDMLDLFPPTVIGFLLEKLY